MQSGIGLQRVERNPRFQRSAFVRRVDEADRHARVRVNRFAECEPRCIAFAGFASPRARKEPRTRETFELFRFERASIEDPISLATQDSDCVRARARFSYAACKEPDIADDHVGEAKTLVPTFDRELARDSASIASRKPHLVSVIRSCNFGGGEVPEGRSYFIAGSCASRDDDLTVALKHHVVAVHPVRAQRDFDRTDLTACAER